MYRAAAALRIPFYRNVYSRDIYKCVVKERNSDRTRFCWLCLSGKIRANAKGNGFFFSLKIAVTLCNLHTLWAKADPSDHSRWLLNRVNLPVNLIIFVAFVFACSSCGEDGVVIIILLECSLADNGVILTVWGTIKIGNKYLWGDIVLTLNKLVVTVAINKDTIVLNIFCFKTDYLSTKLWITLINCGALKGLHFSHLLS